MNVGNPKILLCDNTGKTELPPDEGESVQSPVACLHKAIEVAAGIVVICFVETSVRKLVDLVELCSVLKRNRYTNKIPLLAILPTRNRALIVDLLNAGVDYVKFIERSGSGETSLRKIVGALESQDRIERQLALLCPYLHYTTTDSGYNVRTCGAYMDRLVLGPRLLHELCETENHVHCQYFLNPRLK